MRVFSTVDLLQKKPLVNYAQPDSYVLKLHEGKTEGSVRQISTLVNCQADGNVKNLATVVIQTLDDQYELQLIDLDKQ